MGRDAIEARLAEAVAGRRWILAFDVAAGAGDLVAQLREWGSEDVMVVAAAEGVGDLPDCDTVYVRTSGDSIIEGLRAFERAIQEPRTEVADRVEAFDPRREALVLTAHFHPIPQALGRRIYGARPPAQSALEDKMLADDIWDAAGVPRAPMRIVAASRATATAAGLDRGLGTVWVADNKEGWHGGGDYVRWVRTADDVAEAAAWFERHADRVRVTPFLDGLPCSIHGWVTGNGIAVIRPMEMLILRRVDRTGFFYAGRSTFWDPPSGVVDEMRAVALAVGEHLVDRVGYVGPYGIDGVVTSEGFRPTELNPRLTAGHGIPGRNAGLPIGMMARAVLEGDLDLDASWLEETLLASALETRNGVVLASLSDPQPDRTVHLGFDGVRAVEVDEDRSAVTASSGTSPQGGVVFARLHPERFPVGPSTASRAAAVLDFVRDAWDLPIPPLEPAPDLPVSRLA